MDKIFLRTVICMFFIYGSAAFVGYLSFTDLTPKLIINRPIIPGSSDWLMKLARITCTFNVTCCLPVNINPCRA